MADELLHRSAHILPYAPYSFHHDKEMDIKVDCCELQMFETRNVPIKKELLQKDTLLRGQPTNQPLN